ncbi:MAG TPA: serine/threonine-protein kinase [Terriglobales bacterium]|nr:serine/threonine-protein kinase [Terriglobales bacterium]
MGEVYRADDLRLGHPVALKFLPATFERQSDILERFHAEVRNARQVSHPNVCRVYDVGELHGQQFLTMEFIDGEDLASLLRRIGRLPSDKALEIARQLCAGLAAAHERGVVHRDLKPANIMIDGRGKARITDFGLAVTVDESASEFAGTPQYMSPEQLAGAPATQQSDIYALGLVLYELCTGKQVFQSASIEELRRARSSTAAKLPSALSAEIDPAVERAILRCLELDPRKRPATALQLAAALPGGDPLMAAIAAGETPSPELIAAAGGEDAGITPRAAAVSLVIIVVALALLVPLARKASIFGLAPSVKSPEALADHAQELAKTFGYTEAPVERARWVLSTTQLRYSAMRDPSPERYRALASADPGPHRFAYRQSPKPFSPPNPLRGVNAYDYPMDTPGMVLVVLDGHGHLVTFGAVPPDEEIPGEAWGKMDWNRLLAQTSLDPAKLKAVTPKSVPPFAFDERAEWEGTWGGGPVQVTAAAFRGRPTSFAITGVWSQKATRLPPDRMSEMLVIIFVFVVFGIVPVIGGLKAQRNLRLGRSDTKGALRLGLFVGVCNALALLSVGGYHPEVWIVVQIAARLGVAALTGLVVWVCYMALEPLTRRQAPELLVSWMRLMEGRWRDPRVGRDVLVGLAIGCCLPILAYGLVALPWWINAPGVVPLSQVFTVNAWATVILLLTGATPLVSLAILFLLALVQAIFKRPWVLYVAIFLITLPGVIVDQHLGLGFGLVYACISSIATFVLITRFGPLSLSVATLACLFLWSTPIDFQPDAWYWPQSAATVGILLCLAFFSFHNALNGRKIFAPLLDE